LVICRVEEIPFIFFRSSANEGMWFLWFRFL
jgi:hypothetical protein